MKERISHEQDRKQEIEIQDNAGPHKTDCGENDVKRMHF